MAQATKNNNEIDDVRVAKLFRNGKNQAVRLPCSQGTGSAPATEGLSVISELGSHAASRC